MGADMEIRFYRDANHPDLVADIEAALVEAELSTRFRPTVAGLMQTFGYSITEAVALLRTAVPF